jgi:hypothetical protein
MRLFLLRCAVAPALLALAAPPGAAAAPDCDAAIRHASVVADYGQRAFVSENYVDAANLGGSARIPSIEAARHATACGCKEAVPPLEDANLTAARANVAFNLEGARGYGARLKKDADTALDALRRCAAR